MARLPTPGGDEGNWGEVLNAYLSTSLNSDGTIKDAAISSKEAAGTAAARTRAGLLSARPSASGLSDGVRYFATDEDGGTLYVVSSGAWQKSAPGVSEATGTSLAFVGPSTSPAAVSLAVQNQMYIVPELTTPAFTMPSRPVRAFMSSFYCTLTSGSAGVTSYAFAYTKNGGTNWYYAGFSPEISYNALFSLSVIGSASTSIPRTTTGVAGAQLSAGDTVQVALAITRTDTTSRTATVMVDDAFASYPSIQVVAL